MIRFGTGGWRGIIGDEFTRKNIQLLAKAMSMKMKEEGCAGEETIIGYDRRFLSKEAVIWFLEVMAAEGIRAGFVNRSCPTPLIMFYVERHCLPYGFMVTASHNPAIYNGIKVFTRGGRDASLEVTADIEKYVRRAMEEGISRMDYEKAVKMGLVKEFNPLNEYLDSILEKVDVAAIRKRGLHVVLDPMYGVGHTSLRTILSTARCELDVIHERHDTLFGRKLPAPSEDTLKDLREYVIDMKCDIGIATDGDADRIGVIDNQGTYLSANQILVLLYYYLVKYKGMKGPVVRNVATTHLLDRVAEDFGETCFEVPVGFKHISAKMEETGAVLGGESSGGLTVRGHINGKDGIYATALLVEMIAVTGKSLSELYDGILKKYGQAAVREVSLRFPAEKKETIRARIEEGMESLDFGTPVQRISHLDGCKAYFQNGGWVIARFSGTEPLLRIFCEMPDLGTADRITGLLGKYLGLA